MDTIKNLRKIFLLDLIGLVIASIIFYYWVKSGDLNLNIEVKATVQIAMMSLMLLLLLAGIGLYQLFASKSKKLEDEKEQIKLYKSAALIKFSSLSTTAVLSLIMYIFTISNSYLYLDGIAVVYLLTSLPSELRFKKDFKTREMFD